MHFDWYATTQALQVLIGIFAGCLPVLLLMLQRRRRIDHERAMLELQRQEHESVLRGIQRYEDIQRERIQQLELRVVDLGAQRGGMATRLNAIRAELEEREERARVSVCSGASSWKIRLVDGDATQVIQFTSYEEFCAFARSIPAGFIEDFSRHTLADPMLSFSAGFLPVEREQQPYEIGVTIVTNALQAAETVGAIPLRSNYAAQHIDPCFGPLPRPPSQHDPRRRVFNNVAVTIDMPNLPDTTREELERLNQMRQDLARQAGADIDRFAIAGRPERIEFRARDNMTSASNMYIATAAVPNPEAQGGFLAPPGFERVIEDIFGYHPEPQSARERYDPREAHKKAMKLLRDVLNDDEWREMNELGTITINSELGTFRVEIDPNKPMNSAPTFNVIHKGTRLCVNLTGGPSSAFPTIDHYIAQILLIKKDPKRFLKTANHRGLRE